MASTTSRRHFGNVRKLRSGRWQARYKHRGRWYTADVTFTRKRDAEDELGRIRREIEAGRLDPAEAKRQAAIAASAPAMPTFREYAERWLAERRTSKGEPLSPWTQQQYRYLLDTHLYPTFSAWQLDEIDRDTVRAWHARLLPDAPTMRARAYGLLSVIMNTAVDEELINRTPCRVRGASRADTATEVTEASLDEIAVILAHTPERYRCMVQLAVWCELRYGEIASLHRADIDLDEQVVKVRRNVVRASGVVTEKSPKSTAGVRDVSIPHNILDDLREHLDTFAQPSPDGLVFPSARGRHLSYAGRDLWWHPARAAAGRRDLKFHQLRHTGHSYFARLDGVNLRDLMDRAGHSTPAMSLRYWHTTKQRRQQQARQLGDFAAENVVPIEQARSAAGS